MKYFWKVSESKLYVLAISATENNFRSVHI